MSKKIQIGGRPTASRSAATPSADAWVENRDASLSMPMVVSGKMKRLTIDISESLHRAIKRQCADQGTKIADVTRELLAEWVRKHDKS